MMTGTKFDIEKFDGKNDFALWKVTMKALLEQQGLAARGCQSERIDEFQKLVGNLAAIDTAISDKDQALLLLTSLPSSYDNFEAKGDGGEGLYVRGRSGQRDMEHGTYCAWSKSQGRSSRLRCYICQSEEHLKRDCPRYNHKRSQGFVRKEDQVSGSGADGYDSANVMMAMSVEELLDWIIDSGGSYYITYMRDYLVDFKNYDDGNILLSDGRECHVQGKGKDFTVKMQSGKIKVIKGSLVVLSRTRRANCVCTLDGQAVTRKTLKGRKQLGEYYTGWKIKKGNVLNSCYRTSTQHCTKSGVAKHLGVAWIQQQNGLVEETSVTLLAKVVIYRNIGFNESGEYKKTFISSCVGTGSVQVLQGVEFKVEPQEDHTFEVEPHGNVDHVAGSQEVQTQDLIYYHLARVMEQHSTPELFSYREDSNEAIFVVATVDKIYAHESLTFNNTVAYKAEIWATKGLLDKAKGNVLGMNIVRDQSGNTLRGSLSRECDEEKNSKWSCIYTVGSQEYQVVCTRLDITSTDVGMLHKFDRGLQTDIQELRSYDAAHDGFSPTEAGYMTLTDAIKEVI
ncbi:zinc finger, CCHC-type containing protein [Tanacetum coccineum]